MKQTNSKLKILTVSKVVLFCTVFTAILKIIAVTLPTDSFFTALPGPALVIIVTYLFLRFDKKSFNEIGFKFNRMTVGKFCIGFSFGVVLVSLLIFFVASISDFEIQQNKHGNLHFILLSALPAIFLLAYMEEVAFRGYPFIATRNVFGALTGIIVTSLLFGLYHVVFGWGIVGFCSTTIWGLLFCILAGYSNGISMPSGFHTGINLAQLAFGLTGSSFALWNPKGADAERFTRNLQITLIIAPMIVVLIGLMLLLKVKSENRTHTREY